MSEDEPSPQRPTITQLEAMLDNPTVKPVLSPSGELRAEVVTREKELEAALKDLLLDFAFLKDQYNAISGEIRKVTDNIKALPTDGDTASMARARGLLRDQLPVVEAAND